MKSKFFCVVLMGFSAFAWAGPRDGGGGDEVGVEFLGEARMAIGNIEQGRRSEFDDIAAFSWPQLLTQTKVTSVTHPLYIGEGAQRVEVTAQNFPVKKQILVSRDRWKAETNLRIREALALHEFLSLAGFEQTGSYVYSSLYLSIYGFDPVPVFGPQPNGNAALPFKINSVYNYTCRHRFFEGEGVSSSAISCPAGQHLGAIFADFNYYLVRSGRDDNFGDKQASLTSLFCNVPVTLDTCSETPERQFGLASVRDGVFIQEVSASARRGVPSTLGYAATPDQNGKCPPNLQRAWVGLAQPPTADSSDDMFPLPTNYLSRDHASSDTRIIFEGEGQRYTVWRQPSAQPCSGVSQDINNPTGNCANSTLGSPYAIIQDLYRLSQQPICVIPLASLPDDHRD